MPEQASVTDQIDALRRMTVGELKVRWRELYGEDTRSCNRAYLWKRLAWRVQELAYGGLSERAKARIEELNRVGDLRMLPPRGWQPPVGNGGLLARETPRQPLRDPRLPSPGTVLTRPYRGRTITVTVLGSGFEYDGRRFASLTAVAKAISGSHCSGLAFFGLTKAIKKAS